MDEINYSAKKHDKDGIGFKCEVEIRRDKKCEILEEYGKCEVDDENNGKCEVSEEDGKDKAEEESGKYETDNIQNKEYIFLWVFPLLVAVLFGLMTIIALLVPFFEDQQIDESHFVARLAEEDSLYNNCTTIEACNQILNSISIWPLYRSC